MTATKLLHNSRTSLEHPPKSKKRQKNKKCNFHPNCTKRKSPHDIPKLLGDLGHDARREEEEKKVISYHTMMAVQSSLWHVEPLDCSLVPRGKLAGTIEVMGHLGRSWNWMGRVWTTRVFERWQREIAWLNWKALLLYHADKKGNDVYSHSRHRQLIPARHSRRPETNKSETWLFKCSILEDVAKCPARFWVVSC